MPPGVGATTERAVRLTRSRFRRRDVSGVGTVATRPEEMRKPDELKLMRAVLANGGRNVATTAPHFLHQQLGIPENRATYLFHKWTGKGWWDWGVTPRTGWLTPEGRTAMAEMVPDEESGD